MVGFRKLGRFGRFGNQLFQYAGTRLYAELHGFDFAFPRWIGCDIFEDIKPCNFNQKLKFLFLPTVQLEDVQSYGMVDKIKFLLGITNELPNAYSLRRFYKNPRENINFYGYFQDEFSLALLQKHKEKVRSWFTFKKEIDNTYKKTAADLEAYVGLHIRWGDLVKRGANLSLESYLGALNKIRNQRPVYIATDSPKLIGRLSHLNPARLRNPLSDVPDHIFDFWMLKNAAVIIGGGSTFSWWAAYLGNSDYYSPSLSHLWSSKNNIEFSKQEI